MFVSVVMTLLCTAAIGCYVRFLVDVFKESEPASTGYWTRLKLDAAREASTEPREQCGTMTCAA
jgi:hypothetical protein